MMACFRAFCCMLVVSTCLFSVCDAQCEKLFEPCRKGFTEIFWDETSTSTKYQCCKPGSRSAEHTKEKATGCTTTHCVADNGGDHCASYVGTRTIINHENSNESKKLNFVEAVRDDCVQRNGEPGVEALCCPEDSEELMLTTLLGAELHEFPHFARLEIKNGHMIEICGGTVYNQRHIITASHCVVDKEKKWAKNVDKFEIILDILIEGKSTNQEYGVDKVYIHPNASLIQNVTKPHALDYDIAILKLSRDIEFSDRIQALPLAPKGFNPIQYGDTAIIVGFGDTDTLTTSQKLQKADAYIRDTNYTLKTVRRFHDHLDDAEQLLFIGGYQKGIPSPSGSGGDSGGPAVCRDKDGFAVLCGLTSFGPNNKAECEKYKDQRHCFPTAYVKVDYFRDWIVKSAGDQRRAKVMRQPLYGKDVPEDKYPNQVEIRSSEIEEDPVCGGTLISMTDVLTAAHCVANDQGEMKPGLQIILKGDKNQTQTVSDIQVLDGFRRVGKKNQHHHRPRRIALFATKVTYMEPFYENDLALVKLQSGMKLPTKNLAKYAKSEAQPGPATEVAWVTDYRRKGKLAERKFNLLSHDECQKRMDRLIHAGYHIQVDENTICGVEEYSGGSKCDRSLGGGVFCGETLCGVQTFRICEFAVPSAFMDVGLHSDWIQEAKNKMK